MKNKFLGLCALLAVSASGLMAQVVPVTTDPAQELVDTATGAYNLVVPFVLIVLGFGIAISFVRWIKRK